jgi:hypothetical protein
MAHRLSAYLSLLDDLRESGYSLHPIRDYFASPATPPFAYLRHDVDRLPSRSVEMAKAEAKQGVRATYYFRCNNATQFPRSAMRAIESLGHEVGFHYECLSRAGGDERIARNLFEKELSVCREICRIETISPHGAPISASSNMDFSIGAISRDFDLLGDATAIDFSEIYYITDTGGTFGSSYNLRDRPKGEFLAEPTTPDDLAALMIQEQRNKIVISVHPERWPHTSIGLYVARTIDHAANTAKRILMLRSSLQRMSN